MWNLIKNSWACNFVGVAINNTCMDHRYLREWTKYRCVYIGRGQRNYGEKHKVFRVRTWSHYCIRCYKKGWNSHEFWKWRGPQIEAPTALCTNMYPLTRKPLGVVGDWQDCGCDLTFSVFLGSTFSLLHRADPTLTLPNAPFWKQVLVKCLVFDPKTRPVLVEGVR